VPIECDFKRIIIVEMGDERDRATSTRRVYFRRVLAQIANSQLRIAIWTSSLRPARASEVNLELQPLEPPL